MSRTPSNEVTRALRNEVGFGCPVPECGNPYLEWHHFDPPYSHEAHHRPEGMIALCAEHHKKADAGAYTLTQLREFKTNRANAALVKGSFDWLRNDLLGVVGGNFFYETLNIIQIDGVNVVWFRRDDEGYLRLNLRLLSLTPERRAMIDDNIWSNIGEPVDLRSPPSGKTLDIKYATGDWLSVKFVELKSGEEAYEKFNSTVVRDSRVIRFPITAVEINLTLASTGIALTSASTTLPGNNKIMGSLISRSGGGISLSTGLPWRQNTSPSQLPKYPRNALCPCGSGRRYKQCHGAMA